MAWQKVTEDNPAPKTGQLIIAAWYTDEYLSPEYPIWWDKRKNKWVNWPSKLEKEPMLFFIVPNANTYFKGGN